MPKDPKKVYSFDDVIVLTLRSYQLPQPNCTVDVHVCVTKDGIFKMLVPANIAEHIDKSFHEVYWDDGSAILTCDNLKQLDTVIERGFRLYRENYDAGN